MKEKINVYIAGPMTGLDDYNYQSFISMAEDLEVLGLHAVHTANMPRGLRHSDYMEISLQVLKVCEFVVVLPGYEESKGALAEIALARSLGIPVFFSKDA